MSTLGDGQRITARPSRGTSMRRAALLLAMLIALAGCSTGAPANEPEPSAATTPAPTTVADPYAGYSPEERSYLRSFEASYGIEGGPAQAVRLGELICQELRSGVRPASTQAALAGSNGLSEQDAQALYLLARGQLCPELPIPDPNSFSEGQYEVGVDIQPGRYRSEGGQDCYWARLDESQDIIDNYLGSGPSVFTVEESDAFIELSRCTWTLSE